MRGEMGIGGTWFSLLKVRQTMATRSSPMQGEVESSAQSNQALSKARDGKAVGWVKPS